MEFSKYKNEHFNYDAHAVPRQVHFEKEVKKQEKLKKIFL